MDNRGPETSSGCTQLQPNDAGDRRSEEGSLQLGLEVCLFNQKCLGMVFSFKQGRERKRKHTTKCFQCRHIRVGTNKGVIHIINDGCNPIRPYMLAYLAWFVEPLANDVFPAKTTKIQQ